jgi:prolyl-tRNA synthetase
MGCYGIGVSRLMAAIVEQCHDEAGICWPAHLAPFHVMLISVGQSEAVMKASEIIYKALCDTGLEVLWDERKERPGVKFKDAELMGLPLRVVVGDRGLEKDAIEIRTRSGHSEETPPASVRDAVTRLLEGVAC